jgi:hypothetical protein
MEDTLVRVWNNLAGRIGGPLSFRLVLQPIVAVTLAIRAGLQDARNGRPPYLRSILTDPEKRPELLREGRAAIAQVFVVAVIIDVLYQVIELRWIYPGEVLLVAFLLACVPYLIVRGPVNRMFSRRTRIGQP